MTPEAQRIAMAKACPNIQLIGDYWHWSPNSKEWFGCVLNDPLSDLNAMHEAETKFMGMEGNIRHPIEEVYYHHLREIVDRFPGTLFYHATAAQRAEAFLRTLNLWT